MRCIQRCVRAFIFVRRFRRTIWESQFVQFEQVHKGVRTCSNWTNWLSQMVRRKRRTNMNARTHLCMHRTWQFSGLEDAGYRVHTEISASAASSKARDPLQESHWGQMMCACQSNGNWCVGQMPCSGQRNVNDRTHLCTHRT